MADNTLKIRLLSAYNTLDFWSTCTIIPLGGEVCYGIDDDNKILEIKIGDGVHKYSELPAQSFDNEDHLYKLATPVSTTTAADKFTATTYLQVNDGLGGSSYSNSSSAVLTIPAATTTAAGLLSKDDKVKLNGIATGANKVKIAEGTTNGSIKVTTNDTAATVNVHGLDSAAYTSSASYLTDIAKSGNSITKTKNNSTSTVVTFGDAAFKSTTGSITSGSALPTEGAVKTYVDGLIANATHFCGGFAASNADALKTPEKKVGDMYVATAAGTFYGAALEVGDSIIFQTSVAAGTNPTSASFVPVEGTVSVTNNGPTLSWGNTSTVGTVEGVNLTVKMPSNPNTNYYTTAINQTTAADGFTATVVGNNTAVKGNFSIPAATTNSAGVMTTVQVNKLNGIEAEANKYIHPSDGAVTGTFGATAAASGWGGTVNIPKVTVNSAGHVTSVAEYKLTLPSSQASWTNNYYTTAMSGGTTSSGYYVSVAGNNAAVKGTATIPAATTATYGVVKPDATSTHFFDGSGSWRALASGDLPNSGVTAGTYGASANVPVITVDAKGRITSATTVAVKDTNYYTTASNRTTAATNFQVSFNRNDGTNKYSFTIPEATETMAGVSSTVVTDRLRNGTKTLILDGNFTS